MRRMGWSIDWTREVTTADPEYYRWTQWIFLRLFEAGLAYRREAPVKWCPNDQTVLANEQVIDGHCERCGALVEARNLEQWFFKITDYAERLLDDLQTVRLAGARRDDAAQLDRPQRGRGGGLPRGARAGIELPVFTTRPDTLFGATFFVLAPEHPLAAELAAGTEHEAAVADYVRHTAALSEVERAAARRRRPASSPGATSINPVNGEEIPVWVADYVLMEYGTGAIMAVPAHDERDYEFAEAHGLPIRHVVAPRGGGEPHAARLRRAQPRRGAGQLRPIRRDELARGARLRSSSGWSRAGPWARPDRLPPARLAAVPPAVLGLPDPGRALRRVRDRRGAGGPAAGAAARHRRLRAPGPLAAGLGRGLGATSPARSAAATAGARPTRWTPSSTPPGTSCATPIRTTPRRRSTARRSTTGCRSTSTSAAIEHAILHLMYARFFTKALYDLGYVGFTEPFADLFTQGMIYYHGAKMSKSKGNVVAPDEMVARYGADTTRMYTLFLGPPDQDAEWQDGGVAGQHRFLARLWRLVNETVEEHGRGRSRPQRPPTGRAGTWCERRTGRSPR